MRPNKASAAAAASTAPPLPSEATGTKRGLFRSLAVRLYEHSVIRFLLVGGLSFALDLGLLVILHEVVGVDLAIATPIAFVTSLVFNFLLQRLFTFRSDSHGATSAAKYLALVVFNILVTEVLVTGFHAVGWSYVVGKATATIITTVWNYFLYKKWIFKRTTTDPSA